MQGILQYKRTILLLLLLVVLSGSISFVTISKESAPDVTFPSIYVSASYEGISPQDADSLLIKPLQKELKNAEGLKNISTVADQGHASVTLEFYGDIDMDQAVADVRELVDRAKANLPSDADDPRIIEINIALFPILSIGLSGQIDNASLVQIARDLQNRIEGVPGVLEADIKGVEDEIVEVVIDPDSIEAYQLSLDQVIGLVSNNNTTVNSGNLDTGAGRFALQLPGLVESVEEILQLPIKAYKDRVITIGDVATVNKTFKDRQSFSRINGESSLQLNVSKRVGENIIDTVAAVKEVTRATAQSWPENLEYEFFQDESVYIENNLYALYNNVILATLLVMLVIILSLGSRNALLVGVAIPAAFLSTIVVFNIFGLTLNMVVLFALILSVGMLVDGAIVVSEFADRRMLEGAKRTTAYMEAAKSMAQPVISSTITTLAVFAPLLFWPDLIGDFMQYIPITVITTLTSALVITLLALPILGTVTGRPGNSGMRIAQMTRFAEDGNFSHLGGLTGAYVRSLNVSLKSPWLILLVMVLLAGLTVFAYGRFGHGVVFFPDGEPERAQVTVRARGNLSIFERDKLVQSVEKIALAMDEVRVVSTETTTSTPRNRPLDTIGSITLEFESWYLRRPARFILEDIREQSTKIAGILVETHIESIGPPSPADLVVELYAENRAELDRSQELFQQALVNDGAFYEVSSTKPLDQIDWDIVVDRQEASLFGVDIRSIGSMIRLITNGVRISGYTPESSEEKIDILVRLPLVARNIDRLTSMRIQTNQGPVPLSRFITIRPAASKGIVVRNENEYSYTVQADVRPDEDAPAAIARMLKVFADIQLPASVSWKPKGDQENQDNASDFLAKAFGVAVFVMLIVLVTQFNSFYQSLLILSAIIFSVFGVLIGLMIRGEPFGIVMSGVGIIALSGIVVNNNIILIDTYNTLRKQGIPVRHAILCTGAQRLRPVILTTITTVVGLMPMVLQLNIDIVNRGVTINEPSSQLWVQLASAIAGGLIFAVPLTLLLTPCLLYLKDRKKERAAHASLQTQTA